MPYDPSIFVPDFSVIRLKLTLSAGFSTLLGANNNRVGVYMIASALNPIYIDISSDVNAGFHLAEVTNAKPLRLNWPTDGYLPTLPFYAYASSGALQLTIHQVIYQPKRV